MQTVTSLGENLVMSYTYNLHGKYDIEKVNGTFYKFIRGKDVVIVPESDIENKTVDIVPVPGGRKNRRATRKTRRNR